MFLKTWDEGLAITARAWARNCKFIHNIHLTEAHRMHPTFSSVGENIWAGYPPSIFTVQRAIDGWVNEKHNYTYNTNICSPEAVCGHYTQVPSHAKMTICHIHILFVVLLYTEINEKQGY